MKFYEQLNDILGHKPATRPDNVLDTFLYVSEESDSCTTKSLESSSTHDISDGLNDQSEPQEATEATEGDEQMEPPVKTERAKRKRRLTREDLMDKAIETAMKKVAKMNEESDRRFIELEEKMFDELMMEMEQQQRRENREFQLKIS